MFFFKLIVPPKICEKVVNACLQTYDFIILMHPKGESGDNQAIANQPLKNPAGAPQDKQTAMAPVFKV